MKNKSLLKANLLIGTVLVLGFGAIALFGFFSGCRACLDGVQKTVSIAAQGLTGQLEAGVPPQPLLRQYRQDFGIEASLVDGDGLIRVSSGSEQGNWYDLQGLSPADLPSAGQWAPEGACVSVSEVPALGLTLMVLRHTDEPLRQVRVRLLQTCLLFGALTAAALLAAALTLRHFDRRITQLVDERQTMFKQATEQLYDNIYELNITRNCSVGRRTEDYFNSLGARGLPFSQALTVIAEKQIKKEYRQAYISTFTPAHVIREYEGGNNHLRCDFQISPDGGSYHWMRIDAYVFPSDEDGCLHMFTYRKNIDAEKHRELLASTDEDTGFLTKRATERAVRALLTREPGRRYAFFMFDIDNFKQANDQYGHAFGDLCIRQFTSIVKRHVRTGDVLGRIGGDEFAAFLPVPDEGWARCKAAELCAALDTPCVSGEMSWHISTSIGVALYPSGGAEFSALYQHADAALYTAKQQGKNRFFLYHDA